MNVESKLLAGPYLATARQCLPAILLQVAWPLGSQPGAQVQSPGFTQHNPTKLMELDCEVPKFPQAHSP